MRRWNQRDFKDDRKRSLKAPPNFTSVIDGPVGEMFVSWAEGRGAGDDAVVDLAGETPDGRGQLEEEELVTTAGRITGHVHVPNPRHVRRVVVESASELGGEIVERARIVFELFHEHRRNRGEQRGRSVRDGVSGARATMRRANGYQGRDAGTNSRHIRDGIARVQSAHAVREDVYFSSWRQRENSGRKLVAPLRNRTDGVDHWLRDDMALAPKVMADPIEVVHEGRHRGAMTKTE